MSSFEATKIAAAILVALIVAMVSGLVAEAIVPATKLEKNAYPIAVAQPASVPAPTPASGAPPAAAGKPAPLPADLLAKADPGAGEAIAKKCAACHSFDKGGANRVGPNLYGVIGRPRATAPGFSYSGTLKALGGNWTAQEIAAFIFNPQAYAPGTKMTFAGLPKPEERAAVLAFLNKNSDQPVDLAAAP